MNPNVFAATMGGGLLQPHQAARAKHVIHLCMAGGASHLETFDYKPVLAENNGKPMPESFTKGKPIAQLQGKALKVLGPQHPFKKHGQGGVEISSILPHIASVADDICVVMGGYQGPAHGFRMKGSGDITASAQQWREERNPQRVGSGVFVSGHIFMANAGPNTLQCIDPQTGEVKWQQRATGAHWGSVVMANGQLMATDQNGTTVVFAADPEEYREISVNRLNDPGNSTPAIVDEAVYIRTFAHLYRIGK